MGDWLHPRPIDEAALAAELLRMRHCPERWDFGLRYLDRDLPPAMCDEIRDLVFVRDLKDLGAKHGRATSWGVALLEEVEI